MLIQSQIITLLNEVLGQSAKLRKGGTELVYFCPRCVHYKKKLEISINLMDGSFGRFHCWICHFKGNYLGSLLFQLKSPPEYRTRLFEITKDVRLLKKSQKSDVNEPLALPEDFISLAIPRTTREFKIALAYLKKRGIGIDDICRYNIGYCEGGEYKDCIVVPSYDSEGKLNYFSCRYYYPHTWFKYKNAPGSKNVVGFESFVNYEEPVTLVEGVFDAIAVRNNAVPLFGTMLSSKIKEALVLNKVKRVNLVLDNDALKASITAVQDLWKWGVPVHLVELDKKDPSELGFSRVQELIEQSKPYTFESLIYHKLKI